MRQTCCISVLNSLKITIVLLSDFIYKNMSVEGICWRNIYKIFAESSKFKCDNRSNSYSKYQPINQINVQLYWTSFPLSPLQRDRLRRDFRISIFNDLHATSWMRRVECDELNATSWMRRVECDELNATSWMRRVECDELNATSWMRLVKCDEFNATSWMRQVECDELNATSWIRRVECDELNATSWMRRVECDELNARSWMRRVECD